VRHDLQENAIRHAAGGLFSNADDLCRLARLILNDGVTDRGERIVSAETVALMRTPHSSGGNGLTMRSFDGGDRHLYGHLGSAPPYALSLMTDQQSGYGVIALINTQEDDLRENIPKKIFEFLY
jgi:CubicO group peptidase (beta-lactamase class C family)